MELALACDLRIAGSQAKLGLPETGLAIIPGAGGTQRLPRIVGLAKAKELIYTGRILNAEEAAAISLVNEVVETGHAYERAVQVAEGIATKVILKCYETAVGNVVIKYVFKGPVALRMAKYALERGFDMDISAGLVFEGDVYSKLVPTEDRKEGLRAFTEKRSPYYSGR